MENEKMYRVYCSKCNKDMKKKMSWRKWLGYITFDGRTKGYHDIDPSLINGEPSSCPFGHHIRTRRTKLIIVEPIPEDQEANTPDKDQN